MKNKVENFFEIVEKVKQIPVIWVVGSLTQVYDRSRRPLREEELLTAESGNYFALCPFHSDTHIGSFVITPQKQMWYCFTEDIGWNGIHFEMRYYGLDFKDAILHLANRFGILTDDEADAFGRKRLNKDMLRNLEQSMEKPQQQPQAPRADDDIIAYVYHLMPQICTLKDADRKHLRKERKLDEADLSDYFTFPTRRFDLASHIYKETGRRLAENKFGKKIDELNAEERKKLEQSRSLRRLKEQLPSVPGFYIDDYNNRIDFSSYKGIGFVIRDENGRAQGIQIRRSSVREGESRYIWFSSAFAQTKEGCSRGASSGSPCGVIMPKMLGEKRPEICITEGRFKAEQIAKKGNIAIYVQGVSSWRHTIPIIKRMRGDRKRVLLMFDADMMGNVAVHQQMANAAQAFRSIGLKTKVVLWSKKNGKGFDDLVINRGSSYAKCMKMESFDVFEKHYEKALKEAMSECGLETLINIDEEKRELFNNTLQAFVEKEEGL